MMPPSPPFSCSQARDGGRGTDLPTAPQHTHPTSCPGPGVSRGVHDMGLGCPDLSAKLRLGAGQGPGKVKGVCQNAGSGLGVGRLSEEQWPSCPPGQPEPAEVTVSRCKARRAHPGCRSLQPLRGAWPQQGRGQRGALSRVHTDARLPSRPCFPQPLPCLHVSSYPHPQLPQLTCAPGRAGRGSAPRYPGTRFSLGGGFHGAGPVIPCRGPTCMAVSGAGMPLRKSAFTHSPPENPSEFCR